MRIEGLYRYPVKGFSPEAMARVELVPGATIAFDRAYAIENGPSGFDPQAPSYFPKTRFLMLMKNERVAALKTTFDPATTLFTLDLDGMRVAEGRLGTPEGRAAIEDFMARHFAAELKGSPKVVAAEGHSFSDVAKKVLHLVNLASVRELETKVGRPINPLRFRANLYVDRLPAWSEFDLLDKVISCGPVRLKGVKRTVRCPATNVDPTSAARDMTIPDVLREHWGHMDMGIYVEVIDGGALKVGDELGLEQMVMV